jgi:hypothetical protein
MVSVLAPSVGGVTFVPGARTKARALQPFEDGVPDHLSGALWEWCAEFLEEETLSMMNVEFRWGLPTIDYHNQESVVARLSHRCRDKADLHLTVVEYLVDNNADDDDLNDLDRLLVAAHSIWTVRDGHLGYRVDPAVQAQAEQAVTEADEGPAHWLTEAWNDAYARTPRPGPAYDASIRAVEAALRGIVIPNNGRASITQIINALRDGRKNFSFELQDSRVAAAGANEPVIDTVDTILGMLRALAYGQKTRHGDTGQVTVNSPEESRAAVQLAVSLVQFGTSGALRRG